jgi:hypothetical protein
MQQFSMVESAPLWGSIADRLLKIAPESVQCKIKLAVFESISPFGAMTQWDVSDMRPAFLLTLSSLYKYK